MTMENRTTHTPIFEEGRGPKELVDHYVNAAKVLGREAEVVARPKDTWEFNGSTFKLDVGQYAFRVDMGSVGPARNAFFATVDSLRLKDR